MVLRRGGNIKVGSSTEFENLLARGKVNQDHHGCMPEEGFSYTIRTQKERTGIDLRLGGKIGLSKHKLRQEKETAIITRNNNLIIRSHQRPRQPTQPKPRGSLPYTTLVCGEGLFISIRNQVREGD